MDKPKITPAQQRALKKYKSNVNRITIDFPPSDAELWEHVQKQPNKQGYIKSLIRADMGQSKPPAKWIEHKGYYDEHYDFVKPVECPNCGWFENDKTNYCANCGAKMDK